MPLNEGRPVRTLIVVNTGDRPVQVGSHYHFAAGQPGAAVRPRRGPGAPAGHPGRDRGPVRAGRAARGRAGPAGRGPGRAGPAPGGAITERRSWMAELSRSRYAAAVRADRGRPGPAGRHRPVHRGRAGPVRGRRRDEAVFGGGKVIRESMGQSRATRADGAPDLVITGAVVLDHWGIIKADVGIRDGRIVALGKAGNPDIMDGVHPDLVIGPSTEIMAGNGLILTAGGVDCHVHLICPQLLTEAHRQRRSPRSSAAAPARPRAPRPPPSPRAPGTWPGCWRPPRLAAQRGAAGQGQHGVRRSAVGAAAGRGVRVQAARGLGLDPGRDRRLPAGLPGGRGAGRAAHRHAERGRVRGGHAGRDRRAGPSTPTTPKAPAAATHRTSSPWPGSRTSCPRRPTRPGRTRSTRWTSTWTC